MRRSSERVADSAEKTVRDIRRATRRRQSAEDLSTMLVTTLRNVAVELLQKLLNGEIKTRRRKNVVQARSFAEMLEQTLRRYQNRAIEAAQVIEELIALANLSTAGRVQNG